jgi:hypothetical protein
MIDQRRIDMITKLRKRLYSTGLIGLCLVVILVSLVTVPVKTAGAATPSTRTGPAGGPIYKYLIHRGVGGPYACGDNLFPIYVGTRTGDIKKDMATALNSLFSTGKNSGALYNPLGGSTLRVGKVDYNLQTRNATVSLRGKLAKPDNFCDIARARAAIWATAQQFPEVSHAVIWLGGALLGDLLAAKDRAK